MTRTNTLGQPIGEAVEGFSPRPTPERASLRGEHCVLLPLSSRRDGPELHAQFAQDRDGRDWTYLSQGPFQDPQSFLAWLDTAERSPDPLFYTVFCEGLAVGLLSLMRIDPTSGCLELGNIHYGPALQHTTAATEAFAIVATYVFEQLRYRRLEWKCDAFNERSRRAAQRLGFQYEGLFRQHLVYKGRSRDTAWYSMLDVEWPLRQRELRIWLSSDNFDSQLRQKRTLEDIRRTITSEA